MPAIPGKVNVASNIVKTPIKRSKFIINVIFVIRPNILYLRKINIMTKINPIINAIIPALIES